MGSSLAHNVFAGTLAAAMLTACAGSGGIPNAASSLGAAQNPFGQEHPSIALSGEYVGKIHDNLYGTSRNRLYLSQSQNMLGGAFVNGGGSHSLAAAIVWVAKGRSISGNGVSKSQRSGGFCAFSMSANYKYRRLTGSFTATNGCSGETGTFDLWHKCYIKGLDSDPIRPEARVKPC
jgi:hypothetical protein